MLRVHVVQPGVIGMVYTGNLSTRLVEDSFPEFVEALKLFNRRAIFLASLRSQFRRSFT